MSQLNTAIYKNPHLKMVYFLHIEISQNKNDFKEEQYI